MDGLDEISRVIGQLEARMAAIESRLVRWELVLDTIRTSIEGLCERGNGMPTLFQRLGGFRGAAAVGLAIGIAVALPLGVILYIRLYGRFPPFPGSG